MLVVGLGRYGSAVALELTRRGTEVLAIDSRPKLVESLAGQLAHVVTADATDPETLQQLNAQDFYRAVVAIGTNVEASVLVTSLLVDLGVDTIWAKAVTPQHGRILSRVGAHHVVFPEHDMGERTAHLVSGRMLDYVEIDENFAMIKTTPARDFVGIPLGESRLRSKFGVTVVAVKSSGEQFTYATAETVLTYDDTITVVGTIDDIERFTNWL
ncbi:TrkA family potassium uptake protein [Kribbella sancticallisti]|uniref:potassium channel family protein n=1 Tax=Kribbella sancticallisti TaxID=460087 RepID=UPI0031D3C5D0